MLTVLPVLISVSKAECRTVKSVMDSTSHSKNHDGMIFFFFLPTYMQVSS